MGFEAARRPGSAGARSDRRAARQRPPHCGRTTRGEGSAAAATTPAGSRAASPPASRCVRVAMKPISTLMSPLPTVDLVTGGPANAQSERSDVTAVPAMGVIAEALVALVLADAMLEKFGGDSLGEMRRNYDGYVAALGSRWTAARPPARPGERLMPAAISCWSGSPAAGKSTVGKLVAEALERAPCSTSTCSWCGRWACQ